ncbi:MAG: transposase [Ignavibacteria bacterium]|nr:transposase [Ignavibacteria bacterium]
MELQSQEKRKKKHFDKEFKISAVKMLLEGTQSIASLSKDLGVNVNTLTNWRNQYLQNKSETPGSNLTPNEMAAEINRLRKENAGLKQQNDFLKKVSAYFASNEK